MTTITPDKIGLLDQFEKDREYLESNREVLIAEEPNRWIFVHKGQIVSSATIFQEAFNEANVDGLAPYMVMEFITDKPTTWLL